MSDIRPRIDGQLKNQGEDVLSIDNWDQGNLKKFNYFVEDNRIETENRHSYDRENIFKSSSITTTQDEIFQEDKKDRQFCKFEENTGSFCIFTFENKIKEEGIMQSEQIEEVAIDEINYGKTDGTSRTKELFNEAVPIATRKFAGNVHDDEVIRKSLENDTIKADSKTLKTVTLDRVGRIFKTRGQTCETDKIEIGLNDATITTKSNENNDEQSLGKDKTNSLGRMLKLVDKDGASKKLFPHSRAGSLSRIFRKHSTNETNETIDKTKEDSPGIFSRMFNHLRGRSASTRNKINLNNSRETTEKDKASLPPTTQPSKISSLKSSRPPLPVSSSSSSHRRMKSNYQPDYPGERLI